jgi:hypothetical protein
LWSRSKGVPGSIQPPQRAQNACPASTRGFSRAQWKTVASYALNEHAVARARALIKNRQYVLNSDWGDVQPRAAEENAFLASHSWEEYGEWHLGLTEGPEDDTKARYAFVHGDFRRLHPDGADCRPLPRSRMAAQRN